MTPFKLFIRYQAINLFKHNGKIFSNSTENVRRWIMMKMENNTTVAFRHNKNIQKRAQAKAPARHSNPPTPCRPKR